MISSFYLIWVFLALAIISAIFKKKVWIGFLAVSLILAVFFGVLDWVGLGICFAGLGLSILARNLRRLPALFTHALIILWCIALGAHLFPGFNNVQVLDAVKAGPNSLPFSMYLNIDKPLTVFALIILFPKMLNNNVVIHSKGLLLISVAALGLLPWVGILLGLVTIEFSFPVWIYLFALNNLIFTCVAEEVFFRGYLQNKLLIYGKWVALGGSSLLFGIAHFSGGVEYVLLATIAGGCFGLIYWVTGRLYLAILAHFLFNIYHLIGFTFPLAA
jgi:membrane protease YdiL (CAAX protease family)